MTEVIIAMALFTIPSLGAWYMTYMCLRKKGCTWFMVSGYLTLPKEERAKYKAKFDVVAMNRFAGYRAYLPLSIILTLMIPLPLFQATWYGAILGMGAVIVLVLCFSAMPKLVGNHFEISHKE
ncbi:MAG: DUF3784 domain-containing protein [Defluviitaleaceae bacterium]|nr:DUF3784 domain-containing protein [Defluviitaleaceae bacterium]MCL2239097.1 DUF3784 domain-containing protein [Defluviitaleaceae bacterium]